MLWKHFQKTLNSVPVLYMYFCFKQYCKVHRRKTVNRLPLQYYWILTKQTIYHILSFFTRSPLYDVFHSPGISVPWKFCSHFLGKSNDLALLCLRNMLDIFFTDYQALLLCVYASHLGCNVSICLGPISEEHRELQQLHSSCKKEEQEGVVLKLQSWLRNTTYELDQVRSSLRILEGADEHGQIIYLLKF